MLVVGSPGSGKTHHVLTALERALEQHRTHQARLVVPTASMAQHLTHILARRGRVVPGGLVQTLADFVTAFTPDLREPSTALESYLIDRAIEAAARPEFEPLRATPGLTAKVAATIAEFQAAGCDAETAQTFARTPQQTAFAAVFREFELLLANRTLVHRNQRLVKTAEIIRQQGLGPLRELYFDGFFHFSHGEKEIVEAVASVVPTVVTLPTGAEHPFGKAPAERLEGPRRPQVTPVVVSASSPQNEIEEVARWILEDGRPFRDFLVIARSLEIQAPLIQSVFERFGVPFRLRAPRKLAAHGAVRYLRGLLEAIAEGFPGAKTLEALRHPYSPIGLSPQTDRFDFRVQERLPNDGLPFLLGEAEEFDRVREHLERLGALSRWADEAARPDTWVERCHTLRAELLRLPDVGDGLTTEQVLEFRELARALRCFEEASREAVELLDSGEAGECPLNDYLAALDKVLEETDLAIPDQRHNVVNVVSAYEARQWEIPVAFVCGLVERQFPRYHAQDLFFPDEDRSRLREKGFRLRTVKDREAEERFLFEIARTRATERLVLSHARRDEREQPLLRSFLLPPDYENDRPAAPVRVREEPAAFRPRRPKKLEHAQLLRQILDRHTSFSPSSLEAYLQCPFLFFAGKTLRLKGPPDDPGRRIDPLLVGTIIHRAIANWSGATQRPIHEALDEVLDQTLEEKSVRRSFHTEMLRYNLRTDLARFVKETLSRPLGEQAEQKREAEVRYALDDTEELFINGRIDRYDVFGTKLGLIVDYKYSSDNRVETILKEHEAGAKLQAPLYLLGLERNFGIRPAGMLFWGLRRKTTLRGWIIEGMLPEDHGLNKKDVLSAEELQQKLDAALQTARRAIDDIRAGNIEVHPTDQGFCRRFCDFRGVCRVEL